MLNYEILSKSGSRARNEDAVYIYKGKECFCALLADGLGGHTGGELASSLAVKKASEVFRKSLTASRECLVECMEESQACLLQEQSRLKSRGLKTTLAILLADKDTILWGHVGDSRVYYFMEGKLVTHTLDHSVPQVLVLAGKIKEDEIRNHPDRNRLLRVLGEEWSKPAYTLSDALAWSENQSFLLCSDGFWEWITEEQMEESLSKSGTVQEWLFNMKEIVEKNGRNKEMDNYSAIAIWT